MTVPMMRLNLAPSEGSVNQRVGVCRCSPSASVRRRKTRLYAQYYVVCAFVQTLGSSVTDELVAANAHLAIYYIHYQLCPLPPSLPEPPAERHRPEAVSGGREPGGGEVRLHAHHVHLPGGLRHRRVRLRGEPVVGWHHRPRLHAGGEGGAGEVRPGSEWVDQWVGGGVCTDQQEMNWSCDSRLPPRRCRSTKTTSTFLILCPRLISSPSQILLPVSFSVKLETVRKSRFKK